VSDRLFPIVEREVRRLGGGGAELYARHARVRRFEARDGEIDSIHRSDSLSLSLRVFRNGRMGFSYGFGEENETLRRMVEAAVFGADLAARFDAGCQQSVERTESGIRADHLVAGIGRS